MKTQNYDAIIVGAGLGGVAAGAILAENGMKVLVLEQNKRVGGRFRDIPHKDYNIPVGMHGFPIKNVTKALNRANIRAPLYKTEGNAFYNIKKNKLFMLRGDRNDVMKIYREALNLTEQDFMGVMKTIGSTVDDVKTWKGLTFTQWLENCQVDSRTKRLLGFIVKWPTDHALPDPNLVAMDTLATGSLPFYVKEIPIFTSDQRLPDAFAEKILEKGGSIRCQAQVQKIGIEKGRVSYLEMRNTTDDAMEVLEAPVMVVNIPIFQALASGVIEESAFPPEWVSVSKTIEQYAGYFLMQWYGLKEPVIDHGCFMAFIDEDEESGAHVVHKGTMAAVSNQAPCFAPANKQLFYQATRLEGNVVWNREMLKQRIKQGHEMILTYFRQMGYPPLEEVCEFHQVKFQHPTWDTHIFSVYWDKLPDVKAPAIDGLYFTGGTVRPEPGSFGTDSAVETGIRCADAVLADR